ncbi:MAG TPA: hypothetical protein VH352_12190 [Pseudonocardiaceae bacterium]|jgi:hypothetical protein|nr:hypothetical protein [Pseudonocardiaceae bacterium]
MQARRNVIRRRTNSRAPLIAGSGPLAKVPPVVAFGLVIVVFGLAVWLRGVTGAVLLGLLGVGVLVLLSATWQALRPADRVLRVLVVAILAAVAISLLR